MISLWKKQLQDTLINLYGKKKGLSLNEKYSNAFSHAYGDEYSAEMAADDIAHIEKLSAEKSLQISLYTAAEQEHPLHLRLLQWGNPIALSDILPMLENFDLHTYNERAHKITSTNGHAIWISDFAVAHANTYLDIVKIKDLFQDAFLHIYLGIAENDGFNKLILGASLSWRDIVILRTYAKYLRQVRFRFSQQYIEKTLTIHAQVTKNIIDLFKVLHDPTKPNKIKKQTTKIIDQHILQALESITSLDEDFIIRRMRALIKATLRTNYFQLADDGKHKDYLSIKLSSTNIPDLPLPVPLYEIFVYSPHFEGIHLRNTKVARGGIRWSDRLEDFRTEILGLMKAQTVKNAVIVPSGAKGGFVLKTVPAEVSRDVLRVKVIHCYQSFIRGLLDLTDNIKETKYIRPKNVVCYDDEDIYLVVAADKGTASFSDIANNISKEYDFWLGDAFASGGSAGYDHKKIGITARGAWESIKRHFRELNVDVEKTSISMIGIGDMSGDVFGNGLLYSKNVKLIGAFDHWHIFIDPDPQPEIAYEERLRLFRLSSSSWEDYNPKLISKGGGVFKRSSKSILLTQRMKQVLSIQENSLTPNELIRALLKAPIDLLFNGGIGTYVKASLESDADVNDRTNDECRINGEDLRCKVVGEGGNLGFTQLGRIEYALQGGLINTDFIDNSAGVDCSDHEVNLKILLNEEVHKRKLSQEKRNQLLTSFTKEIAALVLNDNYHQALVMSFSAFHSKKNIGLHASYIQELEGLGILDRRVEYLPDDKKILERRASGEGLMRPELAVLLAYTKIHIKQEIIKSNLPEDPYLSKILKTAFPPIIEKNYAQAMSNHRLRRDIIATQLSNQVVNEMGITFVYRLQVETGATVDEIIRAHAVASHVFGTPELQKTVQLLDFKIPMTEQYEMLYNIRNLISLSSRWFLRNYPFHRDLKNLIDHFSFHIKTLEDVIPNLMAGFTKQYLETLTEKFLAAGLPQKIARRIAAYRAIYTSLNIIDVATTHQFDLTKTAQVYFAAGERVNLVWFRDQIANDSRDGHWNALARLTLRDELDNLQRALTISMMNKYKKESDAIKLVDKWVQYNQRVLKRWDKILSMLHGSTNMDYAMFFIATRELSGLIIAN